MEKINIEECSMASLISEITSRGFEVTFRKCGIKKDNLYGRKQLFYEKYDPSIKIDIKETAGPYGVSVQMVYRWVKSYKNYHNIK